jgi:hypothetical protein
VSGRTVYAYVRGNPISLRDPLGLCPSATNCLLAAAKAKALPFALDVVGTVPAVGNVASAVAGLARVSVAVNHAITSPAASLATGVYGAYGAVSAGPDNVTDSVVGAVSASTSVAATIADVSVGGTKALPVVGNAVSAFTALWDAYQAYEIYQACMASQ